MVLLLVLLVERLTDRFVKVVFRQIEAAFKMEAVTGTRPNKPLSYRNDVYMLLIVCFSKVCFAGKCNRCLNYITLFKMRERLRFLFNVD